MLSSELKTVRKCNSETDKRQQQVASETARGQGAHQGSLRPEVRPISLAPSLTTPKRAVGLLRMICRGCLALMAASVQKQSHIGNQMCYSAKSANLMAGFF